jgi:long-chain fatty acid transport protein
MGPGRRVIIYGFGLALVAAVLGSTPARAQFGLAVSGVGPINRSMGGASTAAPIDANGSLYWNPATISGLGRSEMDFGVQLLVPRTTITSRVGAGSLGPGFPPVPLSGTTGGNNGVFPLPAFGLLYQPEKSPWTLGFGLWAIGGFGVNYPVSRTNPILMPQPPFGRGVAPLYTQAFLLQFAPTVAYQLTDEISIGAAANIDVGYLSATPGLFSPPSLVQTALGPAPNYAPATNGRNRAGGGFQVGVYYTPESDWSFGAAVKSPQWFDTYTFNSVTANGQPASPKFNLDFPLIASVGTAYRGIDRLLVATDFRFLDFRDTNGFRHTGFDRRGQLRGLGWQNVFAVAAGAQYELTDAVTVRAGYTFSLNPAGDSVTVFNLGSPTIIQHSLAVGGSYAVSKSFRLSLTYAHDFQSSITGPIIQPFIGRVPNSSVRTAATGDSVVFGGSVAF